MKKVLTPLSHQGNQCKLELLLDFVSPGLEGPSLKNKQQFGLRGSKTNSRGAASSELCHRPGRRAALEPSVFGPARRLRPARPASGGGRAKAGLLPWASRGVPHLCTSGVGPCAPVSAPRWAAAAAPR